MDEELQVVNSIYENCLELWAEGIYNVNIPEKNVKVRLRFPIDYPESAPSILAVSGSASPGTQQLLQQLIDDQFTPGDVFVFTFIEEAKDVLPDPDDLSVEEDFTPEVAESQHIAEWATSEEIKDRKSVFIGRALTVSSQEEAMDKINDLILDKRISRATHNIQAWRIKTADGLVFQDFDDDGESAAGGRLLHLLTVTDVWNVVVVVSRWYGGIQLGPDRFKHINASAREALLNGSHIT